MKILSDRARAWVRKLLERWLDRFSEGPDAPQRTKDMVVAFANSNPRATRADWVRFSQEHAAEAWRAGYLRGVEYVERDPELWRPRLPPEVSASAQDPGWSLDENPFALDGVPDEVVAEARDEATDAEADMVMANIAARSRRG